MVWKDILFLLKKNCLKKIILCSEKNLSAGKNYQKKKDLNEELSIFLKKTCKYLELSLKRKNRLLA